MSGHPHCDFCIGDDHHWMVCFGDPEDDEPEDLMYAGCKHCDARRDIDDGDDFDGLSDE